MTARATTSRRMHKYCKTSNTRRQITPKRKRLLLNKLVHVCQRVLQRQRVGGTAQQDVPATSAARAILRLIHPMLKPFSRQRRRIGGRLTDKEIHKLQEHFKTCLQHSSDHSNRCTNDQKWFLIIEDLHEKAYVVKKSAETQDMARLLSCAPYSAPYSLANPVFVSHPPHAQDDVTLPFGIGSTNDVLNTNYVIYKFLDTNHLVSAQTRTKFRFTRHLLSCNNINCGGSFFGKDLEPSATVYGISETIKFAMNNKQLFTGDYVYVSNLIRTWMTAVLLYGTGYATKDGTFSTLNLFVSPYLKEYHGHFRTGNYPYDDIDESFEKFNYFLNKLYLYRNTLGRTEILFPTYIHVHLERDDKRFCSFQKSGQTNNMRYTKHISHIINDFSFLRSDKYLKTGDLQKFMRWYNESHPSSQSVHVVTHSHIMRTYLKKNFKLDIKNDKQFADIHKSNCWSFVTTEDIELMQQDDLLKTLTKGVSIQEDNAKKMEKKYEKYSLCGAYNPPEKARGGTRKPHFKCRAARSRRRMRRSNQSQTTCI